VRRRLRRDLTKNHLLHGITVLPMVVTNS